MIQANMRETEMIDIDSDHFVKDLLAFKATCVAVNAESILWLYTLIGEVMPQSVLPQTRVALIAYLLLAYMKFLRCPDGQSTPLMAILPILALKVFLAADLEKKMSCDDGDCCLQIKAPIGRRVTTADRHVLFFIKRLLPVY